MSKKKQRSEDKPLLIREGSILWLEEAGKPKVGKVLSLKKKKAKIQCGERERWYPFSRLYTYPEPSTIR